MTIKIRIIISRHPQKIKSNIFSQICIFEMCAVKIVIKHEQKLFPKVQKWPTGLEYYLYVRHEKLFNFDFFFLKNYSYLFAFSKMIIRSSFRTFSIANLPLLTTFCLFHYFKILDVLLFFYLWLCSFPYLFFMPFFVFVFSNFVI